MTDTPIAYVPSKTPPHRETPEQLRARIPGWGSDLDPAVRPSVPRLQPKDDLTGAHWEFPERQPERWPRERSIEHAFVTPVFGTAQPPKGLSGLVRRHAYKKYGEGRAAHWLLLMAADRIDVLESQTTALLRGRPDNPVSETGIKAELTHHPVRSRYGRKRSDTNHTWMDPLIVGLPWVARGAAVYAGVRAVKRRRG